VCHKPPSPAAEARAELFKLFKLNNLERLPATTVLAWRLQGKKRKEVKMKKAIALALAAALMFAAVILIPRSLFAGGGSDCERDRQSCREDVLGNDEAGCGPCSC